MVVDDGVDKVCCIINSNTPSFYSMKKKLNEERENAVLKFSFRKSKLSLPSYNILQEP